MGGERDGSESVHGNGNANATFGGAYPPATTPVNVVAANGGSGNGNTGEGGEGGLVVSSNTSSPATPPPTGGFQSFPFELVRRLQTLPNQSVQCAHGATINTALLAQCLASQCAAFSIPASCGDHNELKVTNPVANASPACNLQAQKAAPTGGFQSYPSAMLRRLQALPPSHIQCPHGATTNTALLLQFLASQYPAFTTPGAALPTPTPCSNHKSPKVTNPVADAVEGPVSNASPACNLQAPKENRPDLVFTMTRCGKTRGVGARQLKMSDVRAHFHLSVANAAKKLRVSLSTLKNACRIFGLERWPGRKVRSLQSAIGGLKHAIDVGQGAGSEELNEACMRSEVCKLQQEMHELVHGTPAQVTQKMHSPAVKTASIYKILYYRGWRSKYHNAGRHDMFTLDSSGNPTNRASGLAPPTTRKYKKAAKGNQQRKGRP